MIKVASVLGLLVAAAPSARAQTGANATPPGITRATWLAGCWQTKMGGAVIDEHWLPPRGNSMIEVGRTVRGETLVDYELVILRAVGDHLEYEAHPGGKPPGTFKEVASLTHHGSTLVFENPDLAFPRRVGYQAQGADSVVAWIEGVQDGKPRRIESPYVRAACESR